MRYTQQQKDKCNDGYNIEKDKLMTLALNKNGNMCTKDKWIAKSQEEEQIVALSTELDNIQEIILYWKRY